MKLLPRCAISTILFLYFAVVTFAGEWSQFRGPNGRGVADNEFPPTKLDTEKNLKWKTPVFIGHSSPIEFGERLILTGQDQDKLITFAVDVEGGTIVWEKRISVEEFEITHTTNNAAPCTPVTDGNAVYVYHPSYGVIAYDYDGAELWNKPLPMVITFYGFGSGSSPIIAGDLLILDRQLEEESHLLALNKEDGSEMWKARRPFKPETWSTPILFEQDGQNLIGLITKGRFTAYSLKDGEAIWWVHDLGAQTCSSPVFVDNVLYISTAGLQGGESNMIAPPAWDEIVGEWDTDNNGIIVLEEIPEDFIITDRQASDGAGNGTLRGLQEWLYPKNAAMGYNRERWEADRQSTIEFIDGSRNRTILVAITPGGSGNVTDTHVLWREQKRIPEVPSPIVHQNRLYNIRNGGILNCRDADTGKIIYDKRLDSPGGYYASPVIANGHLYVASDRGEVSVIKTGDKPEVVFKADLEEPISASPAIVNNTIYIRSSANLWAFGN